MKLLIMSWIFVLGFFTGGMVINMLIFNRPETIYIAETLVACKDHGGIAYLSTTGISAKCKDGSVQDRAEGKKL